MKHNYDLLLSYEEETSWQYTFTLLQFYNNLANYEDNMNNYTSSVFKITWINILDPYRGVRADGEAKPIFSSQNGHL